MDCASILKAASIRARALAALRRMVRSGSSPFFRPGQLDDLARAMRHDEAGAASRVLDLAGRWRSVVRPYSRDDISRMAADMRSRIATPGTAEHHVHGLPFD